MCPSKTGQGQQKPSWLLILYCLDTCIATIYHNQCSEVLLEDEINAEKLHHLQGDVVFYRTRLAKSRSSKSFPQWLFGFRINCLMCSTLRDPCPGQDCAPCSAK